MSTSQIIWIVVIAVVALALIGLIVGSMRKKSHADNRARAAQLRERADVQAADLPDTQARAAQAEAQAERARVEARRAEDQSATVRAEADQQRAVHEEQIRAADRLDPDVNHKADDYSPHVVDPAGPSNVSTYADPEPDRAAATTTSTTSTTGSPGSTTDAETAPVDAADGSSVTLEPTDTSPRDETVGSDKPSLRDRLEGDAPGGTDGQSGETAGGTHRA